MVKTRRFRVRDLDLQCHEVPGGAPPLVMVHGLTGHRDDFVQRMSDLRDLRVLAPDLRGHGGAHPAGPESYDFDALVADLDAFLDVAGCDEVHLLGHSFGGMVTMRYALTRPERVVSMVLMGTAPYCPDGYKTEVFEAAGAVARERGMPFLQSIVEKQWRENPEESGVGHTEKWAEHYWAHHKKRYCEMDPEAYGRLGVLMVEQESLVSRLGEIRCPVTVMVGDDDDEFRRGSESLAVGLPNARTVFVPDAGHHPHMENPEFWLATMLAHLGWASAASAGAAR